MAPEVLGTDGYSFSRDIWSCGVVLFTLLVGHALFTGDTEIEICASILKADVPTLITQATNDLHLTPDA